MDTMLTRQAASFVGALLIPVAYFGHQLKWMDAHTAEYTSLNAAGSALLSRSALLCWKYLDSHHSSYALVRVRAD
jgi:hypothetical protein